MADTKITKIIIADDNLVFIEGLSLLLSSNEKFEIIDICKDGKELINSERLMHSDLLLIDIEMPEMNGLQAATIINREYPHLPMIAITMFLERIYIQEIIGAGFKGFIHKPNVTKELFQVIEQVQNKELAFPTDLKI